MKPVPLQKGCTDEDGSRLATARLLSDPIQRPDIETRPFRSIWRTTGSPGFTSSSEDRSVSMKGNREGLGLVDDIAGLKIDELCLPTIVQGRFRP